MAEGSGVQSGAALEKFVLQVGINKYQYVPPLDGAVQDVDDLKEVLMKKFDVPAGHFLTLENEQATHEAIISAFRKQTGVVRARAAEMGKDCRLDHLADQFFIERQIE